MHPPSVVVPTHKVSDSRQWRNSESVCLRLGAKWPILLIAASCLLLLFNMGHCIGPNDRELLAVLSGSLRKEEPAETSQLIGALQLEISELKMQIRQDRHQFRLLSVVDMLKRNGSDMGASIQDIPGTLKQDHDRSKRTGEDKLQTRGSEMEMKNVSLTQVTAMSYWISILLFLFLGFTMSLLYLTNFNDANIRSYVYKMISTTLSIFCAVLVDQAIFSLFFDQILPAPFPRGLGLGYPSLLVKIVIGLVFLVVYFFGVNIAIFYLRHDRNFMFAVRSMGGHLTAFAGIATFGNLQQASFARDSLQMNITITAGASFVFLLMRLCSLGFRSCLKRQFVDTSSYSPVAVDETSVAHFPRLRSSFDQDVWVEEACEAEDEATALCLSYLCFQAICFSNVGELLPMAGDMSEHTADQRRFFARCSLILLACVILCTVMRAKFGHKLPADVTGMLPRGVGICINFLALTMAWSCFKEGDWYWRKKIPNPSMSKVVNACVVTVVSVIAIIVMDMFADRLVDQAHQEVHQNAIVREKSMNIDGVVRCESSASQKKPPHSSTVVLNPDMFEEFYNVLCSLPDLTHTEKALRQVIGALGFLVGICWEKSFESSDETIVEETQFGVDYHPVFAKVMVAFVLVLVVFPAWLKYLVPFAQMTEAEHWWLLQHERKGLQGFRRIETNANNMA